MLGEVRDVNRVWQGDKKMFVRRRVKEKALELVNGVRLVTRSKHSK